MSTPCLIDMRIGIFGGAFDPPHLGHEKAVQAFMKEAELDLCYVIPSGISPHKVISGGAPSLGRLEMTRLAFSLLSEKIVVSDDEVKREETSFSYLTVKRVRTKHPEDELFLFVGTDQFLAFETWKEFEYLLSQVTLCAMSRNGNEEELMEKKEKLEKDFHARLLLLKEKAYIISSTYIRQELAEIGFSWSLSPAVNDFVAENGYYGASSSPQRNRVMRLIGLKLEEKRLCHTLSVEREVEKLCKLLSYPREKELCIAALLHDLYRNESAGEQIEKLQAYGVFPSEEDLASPNCLHGITASLFAEKEMGLSEEMCQAIRFHTTGRRGMTLPEKILYFADYIEQTRLHAACQSMRQRFFSGLPEEKQDRLNFLDQCLLEVMDSTVSHLKKKKVPIHPLTLEAKEDLERKEGL